MSLQAPGVQVSKAQGFRNLGLGEESASSSMVDDLKPALPIIRNVP